jgi:hypothetical protein
MHTRGPIRTYIQACRHTETHSFMHTCIHSYVNAVVHIHILHVRSHPYIQMYNSMHANTHTYISYICIRMRDRIHTLALTHTYITCMYMHAHAHIHYKKDKQSIDTCTHTTHMHASHGRTCMHAFMRTYIHTYPF